jgi:hypothetical protein
MLSSEAILIRNGKEVKIASSEIVPGDIVVLGTGDRVPGDIRMLEVNNLACSEAALTGESVPIEKTTALIVAANGNPAQTPLGDRTNMCFSATLVAQGYGVGVVCATGDETEIGTINKLVNKVEKKRSAVLQQIDYVSKVSETSNPIPNPPSASFEKDLTPSILVSSSPLPPSIGSCLLHWSMCRYYLACGLLHDRRLRARCVIAGLSHSCCYDSRGT